MPRTQEQIDFEKKLLREGDSENGKEKLNILLKPYYDLPDGSLLRALGYGQSQRIDPGHGQEILHFLLNKCFRKKDGNLDGVEGKKFAKIVGIGFAAIRNQFKTMKEREKSAMEAAVLIDETVFERLKWQHQEALLQQKKQHEEEVTQLRNKVAELESALKKKEMGASIENTQTSEIESTKTEYEKQLQTQEKKTPAVLHEKIVQQQQPPSTTPKTLLALTANAPSKVLVDLEHRIKAAEEEIGNVGTALNVAKSQSSVHSLLGYALDYLDKPVKELETVLKDACAKIKLLRDNEDPRAEAIQSEFEKKDKIYEELKSLIDKVHDLLYVYKMRLPSVPYTAHIIAKLLEEDWSETQLVEQLTLLAVCARKHSATDLSNQLEPKIDDRIRIFTELTCFKSYVSSSERAPSITFVKNFVKILTIIHTLNSYRGEADGQDVVGDALVELSIHCGKDPNLDWYPEETQYLKLFKVYCPCLDRFVRDSRFKAYVEDENGAVDGLQALIAKIKLEYDNQYDSDNEDNNGDDSFST